MPTRYIIERTSLVVCSIVLTFACCHNLTASSDTAKEEEETEHTRDLYVQINGQNFNGTLVNGIHEPRISIQLIFKNTSYIVDLTLNNYLLSPSYTEKIINESGVIYRYVNQSQELCYYNGAIRNEVHSMAAFSTCEGIKGFIVLNNSTFHIKPLQLDASTLVGLYEIKKANNDHLSQWICGVTELKNKFNASQRVKRQIIADSLDGKNVIELYVANDERRLRYFNGDYNSLSRSTREIVNAANLLYQPVGFFIVLVGVEHWQTDQMEVATDSSQTLKNWHSYRTKNILNKHYNDVGFLISRQSFDAGVLGLASIGTMCSSKTSGGIMTAILDTSAVSGAILAHHIGHNFGLSHDSNECHCESPDVSCIMSARESTERPSMYFSSCSKAELKSSLDKGFDICLKDFPLNQNEHYPVCGNGILEQGEDCDCGRMPSEQCNPTCCNPSTCKLIGSAQCASGACCEVNSCQLKRVNTQCRAAIGPCDLPETCDGSSSFCPKNIYKHDGISCSLDGVDAYCWKGMCRTHRSQCKELYGSAVSEGNSTCYQFYNTYGNINGWCSLNISEQITYVGCQAEDVMCGALQCDSNAASLVRNTSYIMQTNKRVRGFECKGTLMDYGSRVENPGMSPSGAYCGPGKMCVSAKCVPAQSKLDENPCPSCAHGVCTNEGRCLCDQGYYGPTCDSTETSTTTTASTATATTTLLPETSSTTTTTSTTTTSLPDTTTTFRKITYPETSSTTATSNSVTTPTTTATTAATTTTATAAATTTTATAAATTATAAATTATATSTTTATTLPDATTTFRKITNPGTTTTSTSTTTSILPESPSTVQFRSTPGPSWTTTSMQESTTTREIHPGPPGIIASNTSTITPLSAQAAQSFPVGGIVGLVFLFTTLILIPICVAYLYRNGYLKRLMNRIRYSNRRVQYTSNKIRPFKPAFKVFSSHHTNRENGAYVPDGFSSNKYSRNNVSNPENSVTKARSSNFDKKRGDQGPSQFIRGEYIQNPFQRSFVPASATRMYFHPSCAPAALPQYFKPNLGYSANGPPFQLRPNNGHLFIPSFR